MDDIRPQEHRTTGAASRPSRWLAAGALGGVLYGALGYVTPMPAERVYIAWPIVLLLDGLCFGRGWRSPLWVMVGAVTAAGTVVEVSMRPPHVVPGEYFRLGWCAAGWLGALGLLRQAVIGAWLRWVPGARRPGLRWLGTLIWIVLLAALSMPIAMAYMQVHPVRWHGRFDPGHATPPLPYEDVSFSSADGTRLSGWFVPAASSDRTVVVVHGVMDYKGGMRHFLAPLHDAGYNVLLFDLRGHGYSERWTVTYGRREKDDIIAAVDYLRRHKTDASHHVLGVAWSMGAAAMILAAAEDPRIAAVFLDAPYASTADMARHIGASMPRVQAWWMYWSGTALASLEAGVDLFTLSTAQVAANISPRPVLIVHGTADRVVPLEQGRKVFRACLPPRSMVEIPGADHLQAVLLEGQRYTQRLVDFLDGAVE